MITAICPQNREHKQFATTAHVVQEWKVDAHGNFLECLESAMETSHGPDPGNIWTCTTCLTQAIVR